MDEDFMTFEQALLELKCGFMVARKGWNGKGMYIRFIESTDQLNMHLEIKNTKGTYDTWVPSTSDLFAYDWEVVGSNRNL